MEQRIFLLLAGLFIQGIIAAPSPPGASSRVTRGSPYTSRNEGIKTPTEAPTEALSLPSKDAEIFQEFQSLKDSAEQFKQQIIKFTTALSAQLNRGSPLRGLIDQVVNSVTVQTMDYVKQVEASGNTFLSRAAKATSERLRRGKTVLDGQYDYAQKTIEALQQKSEQLFQNGIAYLKFIEQNLMAKLMSNAQFALTGNIQKAEPQAITDENQHLQRRDETPATGPGLTSVMSQQYRGIQHSVVDVGKSLAILSTGSIIGILDALSTVLSTTTDVGLHTKHVLSDINRSGAHAVNSVIGTAGSFVSGTLDTTGQMVDFFRIPHHEQGEGNGNHETTNHVQSSASGNSFGGENGHSVQQQTSTNNVSNSNRDDQPQRGNTPKDVSSVGGDAQGVNTPKHVSSAGGDVQEVNTPKDFSSTGGDVQGVNTPKDVPIAGGDVQEVNTPKDVSSAGGDIQEVNTPKDVPSAGGDVQEVNTPNVSSAGGDVQEVNTPKDVPSTAGDNNPQQVAAAPTDNSSSITGETPAQVSDNGGDKSGDVTADNRAPIIENQADNFGNTSGSENNTAEPQVTMG